MKIFALTALIGSVAAVKKGGVVATVDLPSNRYHNPDHVSTPKVNPKATECTHTTCTMIELDTKLGKHKIMRVTHSNLEAKCARFQTVSRNAGLANHVENASKKVQCGRVKSWVEDTGAITFKGHGVGAHMHGAGGHWIYDGPCECHVSGSHPNNKPSSSGQVEEPTNEFYDIKDGFNIQPKCSTCTSRFAPVTTNAVRLMHTAKKVNGGWYRVTEIIAKDANGNVVKPVGARTDTYHGSWRQSDWAGELFDNSERWGKGTGVHFKKSATLWFDVPIQLGSLTLKQSGRENNDGWKWQAFNGKFTDQRL